MYCNCKLFLTVSNEFQVSWMRLNDITVISMNEDMLVKDKRVKVLHTNPNRWVLRIDDVSVEDDSSYECQVTTAIKTSSIVHLKVLGENLKKYIIRK